MNTPRLLCLGLTLFVGIDVGVTRGQAELPPAFEPAQLHTEPSEAPYGKLEGHGKLLFQELYQQDAPAGWYSTHVYYPKGSRYGVKLQRNLRAMNVFLASEVRRPTTVRLFLKEHLWYFLLSNMEEGAPQTIIQNIDKHLNDYLVEKDRWSASPIRRARLKAKLQGYARSGHPLVTGNVWTFDLNLVTEDGAVEHWLVKGRVAPLQIDSFLREIKEPAGTFQPLTLTR